HLFAGWTDIGLSQKGIDQARDAGVILAENDYTFDYAFVSVLKRSLQTLWHALESSDQLWIPWEKSWKLNDRHWGALQGFKGSEVSTKYGDKQVEQWMKSYQIKPPQVEVKDKRFPGNDR